MSDDRYVCAGHEEYVLLKSLPGLSRIASKGTAVRGASNEKYL